MHLLYRDVVGCAWGGWVRFAFHNPERAAPSSASHLAAPFGIAPHWRRAAPPRAPPPTRRAF